MQPLPGGGDKRSELGRSGGLEIVLMRKAPPASSTAKRPSPKPVTAKNADKHVLYRYAVQNPENEVEFLTRAFKKLRGRVPTTLREDFCGTAWIAAEWVRSRADRRAVGLDLDGPTLAWSKKHVVSTLSEEAQGRLELVKANVLTPPAIVKPTERPEIIIAYNFSYWIFDDRATLLEYFRTARAGLRAGGIFVVDVMGGAESQLEMSDRTRCWMPRDKRTGVGGPYTYIWEHGVYDPITAKATCHIHFEFQRGPALHKAFTYRWRVWGTAEVQDLLREAGFAKVRVYWEGEDKKGGGDGVFRERAKGTADKAFIAYILAEA